MSASMSQVVARDGTAADHLVYPWPYPLGPSIEVSCAEDEVAVVCPAWAVGDRLGPGHHTWHSPDPSKPVSVYFVLISPVEVPFDMMTQFALPSTGQPVTLRARGQVRVQVSDPGLLVAQFVGLPFERINDGLMTSVASSVERMLGKVLPRKAAMAGNLQVVADPAAWPGLVDELSQYNPLVGAVYGVDFMRFSSLTINIGDPSTWAAQAIEEWQNSASDSTARGQIPADPSDPALVPPPAPETGPALPAGTRVLVALADGLFHAATVRQAMQGYYELDIGDTGETVWVPMSQVAPQV